MFFITRCFEARAHGSSQHLPAFTHAGAHVYVFFETVLRAILKRGLYFLIAVASTIAQVVLDRLGFYNLSWVHDVLRIEQFFYIPERLIQTFAKKPFVVRASHEAVAVFAA